jgi:predicted glutamate--cysteine ligase
VLLSKGLEIEVYTGNSQGDIIGLSDRIVQDLNGFVREPDNRNVEYTTAPFANYERLLCAIVRPRQQLRSYLRQMGDYTLIPGSTLSLGNSEIFYRSDPQNPYHDYIEQTYHTNIVTASIHINIGIDDPELLMCACRLIRMEAPLYLALSASSPFLDGKITGSHSTRWGTFPKTPTHVPLFASHGHFIQWTQEQLDLGTMQNVRHLWSSVRPNGDRRPYHLNRLELRICDLMLDPIALLSVIALLEARLLQLFQNLSLDPLQSSQLSAQNLAEALVEISDHNEIAVSKNSLEANLIHWQTGKSILAQDWIKQLYDEVYGIAKTNGFACFLSPLLKILRQGNTAQQWLNKVNNGVTVRQLLMEEIKAVAQQELELEDKICELLTF